jgi:uncharacterized protein YoxC
MRQLSRLEKMSLDFTESIGTVQSVVLHSIFFVGIFALYFFGFSIESILLILTTVVSLEAIYLAIFIQMTINRNTESLKEVEKDVDEIQDDVDEIQKDVDEIQEDVEDIGEDVDDLSKDIDEIQEGEKEEKIVSAKVLKTHQAIEKMEEQLQKIIQELHDLKKHNT